MKLDFNQMPTLVAILFSQLDIPAKEVAPGRLRKTLTLNRTEYDRVPEHFAISYDFNEEGEETVIFHFDFDRP